MLSAFCFDESLELSKRILGLKSKNEHISVPLEIICISISKGRNIIMEEMTKEIDSNTNNDTLFRIDSTGTKMLTIYIRAYGSYWLYNIFAPVIAQINNSISAGVISKSGARNTWNKFIYSDNDIEYIITITQRLIELLDENVSTIPYCILKLLKDIRDKIMEKFNDVTFSNSLVGNIFFLRFVNTFVSNPTTFGYPEITTPKVQDICKTIGRILQFIINRVKPSSKQDDFKPFDVVFEKNSNFFYQICTKMLNAPLIKKEENIDNFVFPDSETVENAASELGLFLIENKLEYETLYQIPIPDFLAKAQPHPKKIYKLFKSPFGGSQQKTDMETSQFVTQPAFSTNFNEQTTQPIDGFATYMGCGNTQFEQQTFTSSTSSNSTPQLSPISYSDQTSPKYESPLKRYSTNSEHLTVVSQESNSSNFERTFVPIQQQQQQQQQGFSPHSFNGNLNTQQGLVQQPIPSPSTQLLSTQQTSSVLLPNTQTIPMSINKQLQQKRKFSMPCTARVTTAPSFSPTTNTLCRQSADQNTLQRRCTLSRSMQQQPSQVPRSCNQMSTMSNPQTIQCGTMSIQSPGQRKQQQQQQQQFGLLQSQQPQPQMQQSFNQQPLRTNITCIKQPTTEQALTNQLDYLVKQVQSYEEQKRALEASIAQLQQQEQLLKANIIELSKQKEQLYKEQF